MTTAARDDPHARPTGVDQVLPRPEADRPRLYRPAAADRRDIRHRGQFAYVEADLADGEAVKLMRLHRRLRLRLRPLPRTPGPVIHTPHKTKIHVTPEGLPGSTTK